ncbi:MAG TPA: glycosyltransferase family 9 protein [Burkholderiaceae bacterium]|nr:glycosyltransferase family 9 protein [Burkholderiaceae bacterium]
MKPERIVVFRALKFGDLLCAIPALRALRHAHPSAHITLVGLPWALRFARRYPHYIDRFVTFPGAPGLPESVPDMHAYERMLEHLRAQAFDLAVQMHGDGRLTNSIVMAFGARRTVGYHPVDAKAPKHDDFWPYPMQGHEIVRNLDLVKRLGAPVDDARLEFPLIAADARELMSYPRLAALAPKTYVCLHPGASTADKRWPPERFAAIGDALADRGYRVVITGSGAERPIAQAVAHAMHAPTVDAACDVSIGGLAHVITHARLIVSNDTGVAHLASALRVPSVVVFFSTDVDRWAPLDAQLHRTVANRYGVPVSDVLAQVDALLLNKPLAVNETSLV